MYVDMRAEAREWEGLRVMRRESEEVFEDAWDAGRPRSFCSDVMRLLIKETGYETQVERNRR